MWKCRACKTVNPDSLSRCSWCGQRADTVVEPVQSMEPEQKKKRIWLPVGLGAAGGIVLLVLLLTVHIWAEASCTEREHCILCGKTRGVVPGHDVQFAGCEEELSCLRCGEIVGPAPGHKASAADCVNPSVCTRCQKVLMPALGHDWEAAGSGSLAVCRVCGEEMERRKVNYDSRLAGKWGERLAPAGTNESSAFELELPIHNCSRLTLDMESDEYSGTPEGAWDLYARDLDGEWFLAGAFVLKEDRPGVMRATRQFDFDPTITFDALLVVRRNVDEYNIDYTVSYTEVYYLGPDS